jgi:hypothetical protein
MIVTVYVEVSAVSSNVGVTVTETTVSITAFVSIELVAKVMTKSSATTALVV